MRKQVFSLLVNNNAGLLSRVAGLFSRRGYNIDSITSGATMDARVTRITVVASGDEQILSQIKKQLAKLEDVLDMSSENLAALKEEAGQIKQSVLMRYIRIFSELNGQLKYSTQKRVLIELAIVKLCKPQMENNYEAILNRLAVLEDMIERGVVAAPTQTTVMKPVKEEAEMVQEALPPALAEDVETVVSQWGKIVTDLDPSAMIMLKTAMVSAGPDNQIILGFYDDMNKYYFDKDNHRQDLENIISEHIGKEVHVTTRLLERGRQEESLFINPNKICLEHVEFIDEDDF